MKLTQLALVALTTTTLAAQASPYFDDFEGPTLSSFWTPQVTSGSITFPSTARARSGRQSVRFNSTSTSANKWIALRHTFAQPTYGCVSIWVFDTGADLSTSNYLQLSVVGGAVETYINAWDYDLGATNGGNYYFGVGPLSPVNSGVDRTQAWHQFSITRTPTETRIAIDGTVVHRGPASPAFTDLAFSMSGPNWRPNWISDFDDFAFVPFTPGSYTLFGTGCAGTAGTPTIASPASPPVIGANFDLTIDQLPLTSAAFGVLGISNTRLGNGTPLPLSLANLGMAGCQMLVSDDFIQFLGNRPTPNSALWRLPIPHVDVLLGTSFHQQVWVTDPGANGLGVVTSNAGTGTIGGCP